MPRPSLAAARAGEPDRYLAALLAPPPARAGLLALAAFSAEIGRVPSRQRSEPPWARSACSGGAMRWHSADPATRTGNPIADALRAAAERHDLPPRSCSDMIDARSPATSAARAGRRRGAATTTCGKARAPCSPLLRASGAAPFRERRTLRRRAATPTAWRACCWGCRGPCRRGACRCRARGSVWPGSARDSAGDAGAGVAGLLAGLRADAAPQALSRAGDMWRICRARRASLSFLWPWSSPICGRWNGRAATFCAARSRSRRSCASAGLRRRIGSGRMCAAAGAGTADGASGSEAEPMRIDAGRSLPRACARAGRHAGAAAGAPWPSRGSCGTSRTPSGSSSTRPTREVHRATWASLSEAERRRPVPAAERVLGERHPDGWAATMFAKTCWDREAQPLRLPGARATISIPRATPSWRAWRGSRTPQTVDCTWLTSPQGRGPRGKAVTLPCDTPVQLDVPYPDGAWISVEIGGRQVAEAAARVTDLFIVGMGDSFASGEGNPDVPVRFSPDRTTDYGIGSNEAPLSGYPARIGDWQDDRRQEVHRGERALAGPGLPSLALFPPAAGRAAARRRGPAPRRDVRGLRLLGRGDDVRPVPASTRATSGCPTRRTCRRSRPSPRRSAAARARATTTCPRPITSTAGSPSSRAAWCSEVRRRARRARSTCCSSRSAATTSASRGWSPTRCWPTSRCCAGSAAGSARCTASPRPAASSMRWTTG